MYLIQDESNLRIMAPTFIHVGFNMSAMPRRPFVLPGDQESPDRWGSEKQLMDVIFGLSW